MSADRVRETMTSNAVARRADPPPIAELPRNDPAALMEQVLVHGDLSNLSREQLAQYVVTVCQSVGLNPLTKPFEVLELDGKLVLYPNRGATDQIAKLYRINREILSREVVEGVYVVTARATAPDGRSDEAIGAVPLVKEDGTWQQTSSGKNYFKGNGTFKPIPPADRAQAYMKAETKAKRRAILSLIGLPLYDDAEFTEAALNASARIERLPRAPAVFAAVDPDTGDVAEGEAPEADAQGADPPEGTGHPLGAVPDSAEAARVDELRNLHRAIAPLFDAEEDKHAAVRDVATASWGVGSLAELTAGQLRSLRTWADDQDPVGSQIKLEYARALDRATTAAEVARIWREIKGGGAADGMLTLVAGRKGEEVKRVRTSGNEAAQQTLA